MSASHGLLCGSILEWGAGEEGGEPTAVAALPGLDGDYLPGLPLVSPPQTSRLCWQGRVAVPRHGGQFHRQSLNAGPRLDAATLSSSEDGRDALLLQHPQMPGRHSQALIPLVVSPLPRVFTSRQTTWSAL